MGRTGRFFGKRRPLSDGTSFHRSGVGILSLGCFGGLYPGVFFGGIVFWSFGRVRLFWLFSYFMARALVLCWFYGFFVFFFCYFLIVGFCCGSTTFSSFAYENITLLQEGNYAIFILYSSISFVTGLLAVVGGMMIIR